MKASELDEPIRSADGKSVRFVDSIREIRGSAMIATAVAAAFGGLTLVLWLFLCKSGRCAGDPAAVRTFVLMAAVPAVCAIPFWGYWLWKRRKPLVPRLVVGSEGIVLPHVGDQVIPWTAIQRLTMPEFYHYTNGRKSARTQVTLCVHLAGPATRDRHGSKIVRAVEQQFYGTDLTVQLERLVGEPEDVLAALKEFAPAELTAALRLEG